MRNKVTNQNVANDKVMGKLRSQEEQSEQQKTPSNKVERKEQEQRD